MNIDNRAARVKKFILTRQNQKGQVAIFVALIFQVIFVFFALLINVGLLVHHKINLQHSVDLAAYYGAMKQAEGMNTIAHVNYQIKQAWKLLTWRYRVLGTFGYSKGAGRSQFFPFESTPGVGDGWKYNGAKGVSTLTTNGTDDMKCANMILPNGEKLGIQDIPFFCSGHAGFANWPKSESMCQLNCDGFETAKVIEVIPNAGNAGDTGFGGNVSGAVNAAINAVNDNIEGRCLALGPNGANFLGRFLLGYLNEITVRTRTVEMLAKNLSLEADKVLDIDGKSIFKGSENTFKNNLTGANFSGIVAGSFQAENGLNHQKCRFVDGLGTNTEFLKKIEFDFINYFVHNCKIGSGGGREFLPEPVYNASNGGLSSAFDASPQQIKDVIMSFLATGQKHTVGYEKNPHCVEYYAVKATSQPNIPFLPLAKITLKASAVAKPFGGSIGPWYGKTWPIGSPSSVFQPGNNSTQVDEALPDKNFQPGSSNSIRATVYALPNFSLFVGDKMGLRDLDYLAAYHSMLHIRDINTYPTKTYSQNVNNSGEVGHFPGATPQPAPGALPAKFWPSSNDWLNVGNGPSDFKNYDSLATTASESGARAIEITAIAPNQFDILHYSIDPDFYNNYYVRLYKGFDSIKSAVGGIDLNKDQLRADLGAVGMQPSDPEASAPLITDKTFSIKDQILLKNIVLNVTPSKGGPPPGTYKSFLKSLISLQSSLLTGWTFASYSDYSKFPNDPVNDLNQTMSFGQCGNEWNKTSEAKGNDTSDQNFRTPLNIDPKLPPVPGNCVTGGRTGYSVKMLSPSVLFEGGQTPIENPLNKDFFNF